MQRSFQRSNRGRIVFRGSYPIYRDMRPPTRVRARRRMSRPRECSIRRRAATSSTSSQFSGPQADGRPVGERLAAHGIHVLRVKRNRYFVPMRQAQRGLIPLLLDGEAAEPMVAAQRITC